MPTYQLRCHHCKQWLGESSVPLELVGMFKDPRQRERVEEPRDSWRCKACGWVNVFQAPGATSGSWRDVEVKGQAESGPVLRGGAG
jgi:hypothetical protein